jgi:putative ABC transport system substrate-binding protein
MKRREFMAGLLLAVTVRPTWAQEGEKVYRIAVAQATTPLATLRALDVRETPGTVAFFEELRKLGYVEGRNLVVEFYSGEGNRERYAELAREVVQRKLDLIFTLGLGRQFKSATDTIPIVLMAGDPVASGYAASLARPGGNITGVSRFCGI